ncbi:MAG: anhydro-N-acetylmuramic acid kinase [Sedimenticolaceae bacterium]
MALFIGVMSGTSMDAIDSALVELGDTTADLRATSSSAWPAVLRERLQALAMGAPIHASSLTALDAEVGSFLADAVNRLLRDAAVDPGQVTAIGCHGQTVAHAPDGVPPTTLQLGDANIIAERTRITTVNDFRRRDMAAGGQGAPLAPAFHAAMLRVASEDRVVLNLGGIANVTLLPADPLLPVRGFDTGPANCLMDLWARQQLGRPYDADGAWAASTIPNEELLRGMLADPFFARQPPKSTGTQYFSMAWLREQLAQAVQLPPEVVQSTLLALTCHSVSDAIRQHAPGAARVLVCGGGVHNSALIRRLSSLLALPVESSAAHGIDPDWMESMAFAWLAQRTLAGQPGNLAAVTGATGPRILGAIHPV